jgi:hypothetical protein
MKICRAKPWKADPIVAPTSPSHVRFAADWDSSSQARFRREEAIGWRRQDGGPTEDFWQVTLLQDREDQGKFSWPGSIDDFMPAPVNGEVHPSSAFRLRGNCLLTEDPPRLGGTHTCPVACKEADLQTDLRQRLPHRRGRPVRKRKFRQQAGGGLFLNACLRVSFHTTFSHTMPFRNRLASCARSEHSTRGETDHIARNDALGRTPDTGTQGA